MNRKSFTITLTAALLIVATGCTTLFKKDTIEPRCKSIMFTITSLVVRNNPDSAETRHAFVQASADLKFLAAQDSLDVLTVIAIIQSLPQLQGETVQIIIAGVTMFFSDELSSFAVANPDEVRLAAKGCAAGIDAALGVSIPPATSSPAWKYSEQRWALSQR